MADITLISGSTLGGAEYVAEHLAEKLEEAGFTTETLHGPLLEDLSASGIWLIISSTHGAGDIPDNLSPFYEALQEQKPNLSAVRFGTIGIGSREYDTFCGAIDKLEAELKNSGAKQTGETLKSTFLITTFRKIRQKNGWDRGLIYSNKYTDCASTVDNSVRKLGLTGSYPRNNGCSVFELCITPHSDPSLYGPGSPISQLMILSRLLS